MNCESIGEVEHRKLKKDCHLAKGLKLKSELNLAYDFSWKILKIFERNRYFQ